MPGGPGQVLVTVGEFNTCCGGGRGKGGGLLRKGKNPSRKIGRGERPYGFKTFFKFII